MEKKTVTFGIVCVVIGILSGAFLIIGLQKANFVTFYGNVGVDLEASSIHCHIRMWKGNELVLDEYHSGVVTDLGDNMTLYKWFGDTDMQYASLSHNVNCSWISIGNDTGTLSSASTQLPNEWNRTALIIDNEHQSYLNASCTFYPAAGPNVADCIGINCASSGNGNLVFYDTFTEVTGIDDTFTINVDFKISIAHA